MPGVPGLSDNITVKSVLGRYLEHSRIFWFENAGKPMVYLGSADMMHRNLDRRIEALINITDPSHIEQLDAQLNRGMSDHVQSWSLHSDGAWVRHSHTAEGEPLADAQHETMVGIMTRKRGANPR
jgi:polyphosphate kinase